jgi:hypothetical protein
MGRTYLSHVIPMFIYFISMYRLVNRIHKTVQRNIFHHCRRKIFKIKICFYKESTKTTNLLKEKMKTFFSSTLITICPKDTLKFVAIQTHFKTEVEWLFLDVKDIFTYGKTSSL